ncbi:MAG: DUF1501 domain-containing protein [Pirellulales bacterium]
MSNFSHTADHACDGFFRASRMSRRGLLQIGGLGLLSAALPGLRAASAAHGTNAGTFGRAKRCIFLFMWGGPSQLDTFDPKPDAPSDIRGEFQSIATNVPGIQISEHLRHMAQRMDKVCVVRSLCHDDPAHLSSGHATLTGHLAPVVRSDAEPPSERDSPHLGSVVSRLKPGSKSMPGFVTLPWLCHHPAAPGGNAPGQDGGWYGKRYSPLLVSGDPNLPGWRIPSLSLVDGIDVRRLDDRKSLLRDLDQIRAGHDVDGSMPEIGSLRDQAFGLLSSPQVRQAFDLSQESTAMRERYGRNIHGQCVLLARRLVEHGVPYVGVNWHNDGKNFWDTHNDNFNRLKNDLIPPSDQALATLLDDLSERGLLDDTLVCWVGEFGRKPQISSGNAANAGRDHWPGCYSGLFAGAGIRGGSIFGSSDKFAAAPRENPVSPQDYGATVLHALGVDPQTMVTDKLGRPIAVNEGKVIHGVFG